MKTLQQYGTLMVFIAGILITGCEDLTLNEVARSEINASYHHTGSATDTTCNVLQYSDTIFYINDEEINLELPKGQPAGTFTSSYQGLALDPVTGAIDVNASETGLRYQVTFTSSDSTTVCRTYITISGINYLDGIYKISDVDSLLKPVYNYRPGSAIPCNKDDGGCNYFGTKNYEEGFEMDDDEGVINLKESRLRGMFGNAVENGDEKDVNIVYRIYEDASNGALNRIAVRFIYYDTYDDVPQSLSDLVRNRRMDFKNGSVRGDQRGGRPPQIVIINQD